MLAFLADSSRDKDSFMMFNCMLSSNGLPQGLPNGKSVYRKRGTPQDSIISRAEPMISVGILCSSRYLATRLTVW